MPEVKTTLNETEVAEERLRRRGGLSIELPACEGDGAPPPFFIATETEMRIVGSGGVYRIIRSDEIDPDVTHVNVPNVIQRELRRGARDHVVARTLGQVHQLQPLLVDSKLARTCARHLVSICKSIANAADLLDAFDKAFDENVGQLTSAGASGVALEPMDDYDGLCRSFFGYAKLGIAGCTDLLIEGLRLESVFAGNMKAIAAAMSQRADLQDAHQRLSMHLDWCKLVTDARNAIEHPTAINWFETRNFMLMPNGGVMKPTYRHHSPGKRTGNPQDFQGNAELLLDKLLCLAEASLIEVGLANYPLPIPIEVAKLEEARRNPDCPARYAANIVDLTSPES